MKDVWRGKVVPVFFNAFFDGSQGVVGATLDFNRRDVVP
jgi:hypothetical protein